MARSDTADGMTPEEDMSPEQAAGYLTARERRFVEEYLTDLNGTQAAIRAGYKPGKNNASAAVAASRLMKDERVRAYRAALIREKARDMDINRENVALKLLEIYGRCMDAEPVMQWDSESKQWVPSGNWRFDASGAIRALAQLSKLMGLDAPQKHEIQAGGIEDVLRQLGGERSY